MHTENQCGLSMTFNIVTIGDATSASVFKNQLNQSFMPLVKCQATSKVPEIPWKQAMNILTLTDSE